MNKILLIVDPQIDFISGSLAVEGAEETYMLAGNVVHIQANKKSDLYKKYGEDVVNKVWSRHLSLNVRKPQFIY